MAYLFEAAPIWFQRFYTGWITLRNQLVQPIRLMGRRVIPLLDSLLAGTDLEITPRLTLQRRPGYINYFSGAMNGTLLNTYSWKTASQGIFQIFDTTVDIEYIPQGATSPTVIFTKPNNAVGNKAFMFGVGNYLFVSGVGFAFKWDGPTGQQGVTNWGITNSTASTGATITGNGANSGTGTSWTNPNNVTSTTAFSLVSISSHGMSKNLNATQFGFAIGSTFSISGIQLTLNAALTSSSGAILAVLLKNGTPVGSPKIVIGSPSSGAAIAVTVGSASDLWGTTWTYNDINQTTFGVAFYVNGALPSNAAINNVNLNIFSGGAPTVSLSGGAGALSAVNGYSYVVAYGNSVSGEISNATVASNNTGAFTNKTVIIPLTASTDTQVNQIRVYRTTDSGGGSIFYELPTSPYPNTTGNVNDNAFDTALQINSQAATALQNTPPPANMTAMEWFAGRMWGVVGGQLYFSTGPDSLSGLQQSNWNPSYVFVIPTSVTRLTALPNGMLVHTLDDIKVVRGTATTTFTVNDFMKDVGVWNYNAVDTDGSNVYVFTADRQFIVVSASGIEEVGPSGICPIADQLQNVDPTQAYVTVYRSGLDSMVFLMDTAAQVLYPYNSRQQAWCLPALLKFANITATCAMEVQPGIWKYLIGAGTSLAQRDLNTFTDLGKTYAPQVIVGTIQEADPGTLAKMENVYLELTNAGSVPTVSILPNDQGATLTNPVGSQITGKFITLINPVNDPPTYGQTSVNYRSLRYQWLTSSAPEAVKYVQILIQWPAEAAQNEVLGLGLSGKQQGDSPNTSPLPQLMGH